ncbi:NAD(P)-dependent oxidoreductase [Glaciimonas immobilis]|uniref:3-hydroxyisobutyrate dehydrogenase-like beta-hydroxyacid dehydrogenase n=1 Tax=Glaciimonas immobilis TaxID=728004 RepID=A0A840RMT0_9BURK|nr:NAD(P)-dependent oxidoreductase [Glaciimonas immobilis]KAF3998904.1 NAD(P)-dependent oxidoreductase [Glaciimonas immobilis]MBB5198306.1 3-hydroxyisobutyrate dehydrogenase-like beta-hydroxyacid dehydrogenase [Glaciimonas immobilis]
MAKVTFIGLGVMGSPMAGHLARHGHEVTVFNRTQSRAELWATQNKGQFAPTIAAACKDAEFVFTCVGNDNDLFQITLGDEGILANMKAGGILIDNSTCSADAARKLSQAASTLGISFLDAPVSGGQAGAENGALTVMVGGTAEAFKRAEPVIASYARAVVHMGPAGSGQLTKMVNQICIAGLVQALAEGLAFAERAGLDGERVIDAISKGAAQSWQMENRGKTMLASTFDFGFAVDLMRKDLGICFDEAQHNGSQLPVTRLVDQFYAEVQNRGGNRLDTSSLMMIARTEEKKQ